MASRAAAGLGVLVLVFQALMIGVARFDEKRYFCWAPFDSLNRYDLARVVVNGLALSDGEILARYRLRRHGFDQRSIAHVKDFVIQYESTYGRDDTIFVEMQYTTNSGPVQRWLFSRP